MIRIAFERMADHLIARDLLDNVSDSLAAAFRVVAAIYGAASAADRPQT